MLKHRAISGFFSLVGTGLLRSFFFIVYFLIYLVFHIPRAAEASAMGIWRR